MDMKTLNEKMLKNLDVLELSEYIATLDIETVSTEVNAAIGSIGLCIRSMITGDIKAKFYVRIDVKAQTERHHCQETLQWWMKQIVESPEAAKEMFDDELPRISLKEGLLQLNTFLEDNVGLRPKVFGNGNDFDNSIVKNAMDQHGITPFWDHGCDQNLRTAVLFGRMLLGIDPKYNLEFKGHKHNALDDAIHESEYLYEIFNAFKEALCH